MDNSPFLAVAISLTAGSVVVATGYNNTPFMEVAKNKDGTRLGAGSLLTELGAAHHSPHPVRAWPLPPHPTPVPSVTSHRPRPARRFDSSTSRPL